MLILMTDIQKEGLIGLLCLIIIIIISVLFVLAHFNLLSF